MLNGFGECCGNVNLIMLIFVLMFKEFYVLFYDI